MKIADRVYWVGSGAIGLSEPGDCHTYVLEGSDALALIDCGMHADPARILRNMEADGLNLNKLRFCLLTHVHYDHVGGCKSLQRAGISIVGSRLSDTILQTGCIDYYKLTSTAPWMENWRAMPSIRLDRTLDDQEVLSLGDVAVKAIHTPGHSPDSVCYLGLMPDGRKELFSGDEVFYKGFISVLSPPLTDLQHYPQGIQALSALRVDGLYPGHLIWVLQNGQQYIDIVHKAFCEHQMPVNKPFS
jgi:glyoxylase-like metal-dependent hydrolase (beta-lactamase superfamily II)